MKKMILLLAISIIYGDKLYAQQIRAIAFFSKIGYTSFRSVSVVNKIAPPGSELSNNFFAFGAESYFRANKRVYGIYHLFL